MAVPAIDAGVSYVMGVAELKRLFDKLVGASDIRRAPEDHQEADHSLASTSAATILTFARVLALR